MPDHLFPPAIEHLIPTDLESMFSDSHPSSILSGASTPLTTPDLSDTLFEVERLPCLLNKVKNASRASSRPTDDSSYILVIGGLGYIGSHTALELLREGYNVIIVDNLSNSFESVFHRLKQLATDHRKSRGLPMPMVHFHNIDYRSRHVGFLLDTYSDLVPAAFVSAEPSVLAPSSSAALVRRSHITGVIHFAAHKSVSESIDRPLSYYSNNLCGLVSLLQRLDEHGVRSFIFSSSATVYGDAADHGQPLREEDLVHAAEATTTPQRGIPEAPAAVTPRQPGESSGLTCPYARTKYFGEAVLADVARSDARWRAVALRYFNPIGCDPSGQLGESPRAEPTNLFPVLTRVLDGRRARLDVFGSDWDTRDGTAVRDYIHVLDVARGHIAALRWNNNDNNASTEDLEGSAGNVQVEKEGGGQRKEERSGRFRTFNLGSGSGTTVLEAVRSLEAAAGKEIPMNWTGRRDGDVGFCVASTDRAARELGWSPRESVGQCAVDLWNFVQRSIRFSNKGENGKVDSFTA